jgi:ketosteroid isomerase-like protein
MRYLFSAFALFSLVLSQAQSNDEMAVRKILNDQSAAWNRGDIESFMKGYWENDSLMFIGKSGITYGWSKTLANYKRNYPDTLSMGKLAFTIISVRALSAEYYHVIGKWHLQRSIGNLEGHFTLLFRKINGEWMIIADHSS